MPRPGPRPYECVRRAWHSDRHQPIRGSLIQHIFRVVNEAHLAGTKKNKEWQEKLPIVVLKAEEIMYSKANSEVEYSNLETVWDRVNDAINTIIRREETTESGDLMPPCVEAALNLGCVPVRASRSQRHSNPRTYLTPRTQDPPPVTVPRVTDRANDERAPQFLQFHSRSQLAFPRTQAGNCPNFHSEPNSRVCSHAAPSIYPVYYGAHYQTEGHQTEPRAPEPGYSKTIYAGTPVNSLSAAPEPTMQDYFMSMETVYRRENPQEAECDPQEECWAGPRALEPPHPKTIYDGTPVSAVPEPTMLDYFIPSESADARENPPEAECDLSLRLGTFLHPIKRKENVSAGVSLEQCTVNDMWQPTHTEFCFFPAKPAGDPNESGSRSWKGKEPFRS